MRKPGRVLEAAYAEALRGAAWPGVTVLDLGGDCGRRAVLACRHGAGRVYSVQAPDALPIANQVAAVNGCIDRIEFIERVSGAGEEALPVDLVLAELPGGMPLHGASLARSHRSGRRRWPEGAATIPRQERMWAAVIEADDQYRQHVLPWDKVGSDWDLAAARRLSLNSWSVLRTSCQMLVDPQNWAIVDYASKDAGHVRAQLEWTVSRSGVGHGLAIWSEIVLAEGNVISTSWGNPNSPVGQAFFPWLQPVTLVTGDRVTATIQGAAIGFHDIWSWTTHIAQAGRPVRDNIRFAQSTFLSSLELPSVLGKARSDYVPSLGEQGHIDRLALALMDDRAPLEEVARTLAARFPARFSSSSDAMTRVATLFRRYGMSPDPAVPTVEHL